MPEGGTVVLRDVHRLTPDGQRELLGWLNDARGRNAQLVSVTPIALLPSVEANRFDAQLYYRLNTIHIVLAAA
jgi:DNA-binding NtrC family response regulator